MQYQNWYNGWLTSVEHKRSPNYSERPQHSDISLIVIHNISLPPFEYGSGAPEDLFLNQLDHHRDTFIQSIQNLNVSTHFLIDRSGLCRQYVSCDDMAYHAGLSYFKNRGRCNEFSIGIELEGCDFEPFTIKQYQALIKVLKQICIQYPIQAICGHSDIAPDRKTDPGYFFDWEQLKVVGLPVYGK